AVAAVALHFLAWGLVRTPGPQTHGGIDTWLTVTAMLVLPFSLMASQAMESVTRAFYSRSDLDLVVSSPASIRRLFAVRVGAIALSTSKLSLLLGAPLINVLAVTDHAGWLAAYPVLLALGALASVLALTVTIALFRLIGARRTRLAAQIVAALVGASFIIGIQLAAIGSMGTLSRMRFLSSEAVGAYLPDAGSPFWYPARAASGELLPLAAVLAFCALAFALAIATYSGGFADKVVAAAGIAQSGRESTARAGARRQRNFRRQSVRAALRRKEWKLLARDHWLISQTLMQVFYLVPPAFMLWQGFGSSGALPAVVVPVLVMASGQLAGGLAWLAISGEDAPQLVATAPVTRAMILRAKIEAVLGALVVVVAPILAVLAWASPRDALVCLAGIAAAGVSATLIQLWFRSQAKRSNFRRRQTSSRVATLAEAFSSIFWAGTAALMAIGSWFAVVLAALALAVLVAARSLRAAPDGEFA
ncbi:MAG: permease, partial [Pseudomonadota bacterium]|nr:permease [Pseudomonadota bacterium]